MSTVEQVIRPATARRKAEHLRLAMDRRNQLQAHFFDDWRLEHDALPELSLDALDTHTSFLGRWLDAPVLISCMTGGTGEAGIINRNVAAAAQACGVAVGVGSQRAAIEDPSLAWTFQVRELAPDVPLLANLGAVQLNHGYGLDECREAVDMIGADALVLHLNVLQEAIQPEGDTDFRGLLDRIGEVAVGLHVPVIVKEIGCGISASVARRLQRVGVHIVDVAGLGGTSWARIESRRAPDAELGERFAGWGIPTPDAIRQVAAVGDITVIGSGGVRTGIDVAKALALGASLAGLAQPFLGPARESAAAVEDRVRRIVRELRVAMLCSGAGNVDALSRIAIRKEVNAS